uniref:DUF760 domain-containing protein n=1 Tax=Cyanothece sp. (strain PCC 7425 / ATCC 29141) TaxID=395961 RepID=B8HXE8_CYAP4
MDNSINQLSFQGEPSRSQNKLWQYVQAMEPEAIAQMSKPASQEVVDLMERHIVSLLGALPGDQFGMMITTSRENLGRLIAASMMNGYFLRGAEQRMAFEKSLFAGMQDPAAEP